MTGSTRSPQLSQAARPRRVSTWLSPLWGLSLVWGLSLACALLLPTAAAAKPKVHVVYSGQRLGSIAKRYNVTIDELCKANGISRRDPIKPGQRLIIPGSDDGKPSDDKETEKAPPRPAGPTRFHQVAKGHTLGAIAGRYAITVGALCNANGITRSARLSVGQRLIIPHRTDKDGAYARRQRLRGSFEEEPKDEKSKKGSSKTKSWAPYVKPAWRRGYIKIRRYGRYWAGYVIGPKNQVLGHASNKINYVLGAADDGPRIDPKLVRLIASISDKFGGREMRIVSGYRTKSFVAASKHKEGKALDFSIPGVPNEALRDYLRTIDNVGVGYYPNSSFVHVDVRGYNSYWIDYAGPGEPPRTRPGTRPSRHPRPSPPTNERPENGDGPINERPENGDGPINERPENSDGPISERPSRDSSAKKSAPNKKSASGTKSASNKKSAPDAKSAPNKKSTRRVARPSR